MKDVLYKYMSKFTDLTLEEQKVIVEDICVKDYKKGTVLLKQGEIPSKCYFVLKGCIRQFSIDEMGKEITSNFYTEEQSIIMFHQSHHESLSPYTYSCLENTVLVVCDAETENTMYDQYLKLETMIRKMTEENLIQVQDDFAAFIASTPEERYKALLRKQPDLFDRVPQHQLASYLGITPESFSRIKKRLSE
ncbi:Crp/Fnr family transcriptional regulator [Gracilibacillus suaedae]|uniref:Crp/Fnr family transcriptional regulator n=1 Tax=Gracilibacillus suaedae TaxID=2820273 RepID=UPI001ABEBCF3|nr:Crp/Fnr family transcriptional regulator [Gracilibacillus suaedae]